MKNKFDTLKIFIIIGIIVVLSSLLYFNSLESKESGDSSVSFIEQELQLSDEQYETFIDYPQLSGMKDKEKEKRLNALIEKDVMRILEHDPLDDGHFVIVIFGGHTDYNEYAISLQDAGLFLQKEFLNRIS